MTENAQKVLNQIVEDTAKEAVVFHMLNRLQVFSTLKSVEKHICRKMQNILIVPKRAWKISR